MVRLRIRRRLKEISFPLVMLCLTLFGLLYFCEVLYGAWSLSNPGKRSKFNVGWYTKEGEISVSNRTGLIWNFATSDTEKIYLYKKLLTKEHFFNKSNLEIFRNEFEQSLGTYFNNNVVIDRQNTPTNHTFTFEFKKKTYKKQISEDIHKLLPNNITYKVIPRCSIVGNSGSILNSSCGKHIDKADFVFRCNAAPIKAFVVDAGTKTNFTTFNPSIFHTRYGKLTCQENVTRFLEDMKEYSELLWAPCFTAVTMEDCTRALKLYNLTENKFVLGYPDHFQKMQEFWNSRGFKKRITTCVGISITSFLFGFITFTGTYKAPDLEKGFTILGYSKYMPEDVTSNVANSLRFLSAAVGQKIYVSPQAFF